MWRPIPSEILFVVPFGIPFGMRSAMRGAMRSAIARRSWCARLLPLEGAKGGAHLGYTPKMHTQGAHLSCPLGVPALTPSGAPWVCAEGRGAVPPWRARPWRPVEGEGA